MKISKVNHRRTAVALNGDKSELGGILYEAPVQKDKNGNYNDVIAETGKVVNEALDKKSRLYTPFNNQKVIIDKTYDEIELEASQYFKTEWIQKGSLSNYNSENMSLVYVYIKVKNIASNTAECPIGMASIGNYYDDNKYYRLSECAAIYPSSYERTTHCLYDDINAGEEKVYIVLFKVLDNYTDNDGSYSQLLINPCLELEINPATQGKKAPLVILDNISRE